MRKLVAVLVLVLFGGSAFADANIIIINTDSAGVGFNDPTPATPVGGNTGTTLGEQRLIAFNFAAELWGGVLGSSPTIRVSASFSALSCTSTSAVLGSAGPATIHANFSGVPFSETWYPQALANNIAGFDQSGQPDMVAQFNGNIDFNDNCLSGRNWYYGLDNNSPGNTIDFLNTVMHELGHGLGFSGFVNLSTGALQSGLPDVFARFTYDNSQMLHWDEMSNSQRASSARNSGNLVWDGPNATSLADELLSSGTDGNGFPRLYAPSTLQVGSSVYHWDTSTSPNTLMEPFLSGSLEASETLDLTPAQMKDIGWTIVDQDEDLIPDDYDNCPADANPDQADIDGNGVGDACDSCASGPDGDSDGIPDDCDNCVGSSNPDQLDTDIDGDGDACDFDDDNDTVNDSADNCPLIANLDQADFDMDGAGNACDTDDDDDSIPDVSDNCPLVANPDQSDFDSDSVGDACDNCIEVSNADQYDSNGDGFGNICDADLNNDNGVNFLDLARLKQVFLSTSAAPGWDPDVDLDNSGAVNFSDLGLMKAQFLGPPGPSAFTQ